MTVKSVIFGGIKFSIIAYLAIIAVGVASLSEFGSLASVSGAIIVFGLCATTYALEA